MHLRTHTNFDEYLLDEDREVLFTFGRFLSDGLENDTSSCEIEFETGATRTREPLKEATGLEYPDQVIF